MSNPGFELNELPHPHDGKEKKMYRARLANVLTLVVVLSLFVVGLVPAALWASSHREAPLISKDAFADNTDTYVFIPAGQTDNIVLAASWIPFEGPEGGPNYWEWSDDVLYDIYVDNDGDAVADVTYTLSSNTEVPNPNTFLYNTGPITSLDDPDWNRPQRITVTEKWADGPTLTLVDNQLTAPVNIGDKSTPNYSNLAAAAIYSFTDGGDEILVFGGQTDDAFYVDLQVFDLLTLRGQPPPIGYAGNANTPVDSVSGFNAHSLVIEVPISRLVESDPVLGVWATSRRPSMTVLSPGDSTSSGDPVQVSRLGMPLVNEVVIPLALKDAFNGLEPQDDLSVYLSVPLLQQSVEDPEVGTLLCALYGVPLPEDANDDCHTEFSSPGSGRGDIFEIFLTGMVLANPFTINTASGPVTLPAGFNVNQPATVQPAEMIRINTTISGELCAPSPSRLGVLGGDACGFPNGRRLTDDVVEIELLAVAGAAYQALEGNDPSFTFDSKLIGKLTDGIDQNDLAFSSAFPYLATAQSGQRHVHQNPSFKVFLGPIWPWFSLVVAPLPAALAAYAWLRRRRKDQR
jgi:hypothetical protein